MSARVSVEWQRDESEERWGDRGRGREWTDPVLSAVPSPPGGARGVCVSLPEPRASSQKPHKPVSICVRAVLCLSLSLCYHEIVHEREYDRCAKGFKYMNAQASCNISVS